jgi:hypothetical protein
MQYVNAAPGEGVICSAESWRWIRRNPSFCGMAIRGSQIYGQ